MPLEGDSEEKRNDTGGDLSWGVSSSSHMLGVPRGLAQGRGTLRTFVLEDHRGLTR